MTDLRTAHEIAREIVRADTYARLARTEAARWTWLDTRGRLVDERYIRLREDLVWTAEQAA